MSKKFLIVVSDYYKEISQGLYKGAIIVLDNADIHHDVVYVPGALELPYTILLHNALDKYDAFVALGCVIRGETYHFDIVANESARGLMDLSLKHRLIIGNGIITAENEQQAIERSSDYKNVGAAAAKAALSLYELKKSIGL